MVIEVCHKFA